MTDLEMTAGSGIRDVSMTPPLAVISGVAPLLLPRNRLAPDTDTQQAIETLNGRATEVPTLKPVAEALNSGTLRWARVIKLGAETASPGDLKNFLGKKRQCAASALQPDCKLGEGDRRADSGRLLCERS